jgi:hypothetical protein
MFFLLSNKNKGYHYLCVSDQLRKRVHGSMSHSTQTFVRTLPAFHRKYQLVFPIRKPYKAHTHTQTPTCHSVLYLCSSI